MDAQFKVCGQFCAQNVKMMMIEKKKFAQQNSRNTRKICIYKIAYVCLFNAHDIEWDRICIRKSFVGEKKEERKIKTQNMC